MNKSSITNKPENQLISIIVAIDKNNLIGDGDKMPWYLPADLKHFKTTTTGHTIIMGHKTYRSLPNGALPNRRNIVLSRSIKKLDDAEVYSSPEMALAACENEKNIFIIGGAQIYSLFLPFVNQFHITRIHHQFEGSVYFPMPKKENLRLIEKQDFNKDEKNKWNYSFEIYKKKE